MGTTSRRSVLQSAALPAINLLASPAVQPKVVVVGAGAFGGWTALHLLRMGARVTLVDAWGPGNSRASSGGETRIIRATYGTDKIYYEMVKRSLEILRDSERCWNRRLYHNIGCLVFAGADESYARSSLKLFQEVGLPAEELSAMEATKRWPQISFEGIRRMVYEKDAGYLTARRNCALVLDGFLREGGVYRQLEARPGRTNGKTLAAVKLSDNAELAADYFVFAVGHGWGRFSRMRSPRVSGLPSSRSSSSGRNRATPRSTKRRFPVGSTTQRRRSTAFPEMSGAASRSPTIAAGRTSIRPMANASSHRNE